ncbi:MAG TPA: response regulator [Pirellulaceae bacterium]|nr:response regulator [Pirellulaceae bacterium]
MVDYTHRILIVDDEADTCANLSDILTDLGYQVDTANDGFAALELVKENAYDIALLDLRMPGMDGVQLYRRIREISAGTVAIVVTAYASSDTARSARAAGAWQVLPKPVHIGNLLGLVSEALDAPLILVVDDDCELCENLWDVMREHGYRVHLAHDVPDAEQAIQRHAFQVVLVDMRLPSGDGGQVLRLLRQKDQSARALIITGFASEMERRVQEALAAGATAVCYKPFDVEKLLTTVHDLCKPPAN